MSTVVPFSRPAQRGWARFTEARRRIEAAQKPGTGVPAYTRWVNRRGARLVAAGAYALRLSPDTVTWVSAALSGSGIALLIVLPPSPALGSAVAALLALGYLFDSADGQLARLYGRSSKAGEWLDHVVDAFRTPAIHAGVAIAVIRFLPEHSWLALVALLYCLISSGQFLSQILAGALITSSGHEQVRGGVLRSVVLLPTDPGILCWSFLLWGIGLPFGIAYTALAVTALLHSALSLVRRWSDLTRIDALGTSHA